MQSEFPHKADHYNTRDAVELAVPASRFLRAVTQFNEGLVGGGSPASYEIFASPDDAEPPIEAPRVAQEGEFYTRFRDPGGGAYDKIRRIESLLIHEERPQAEA